MELRVRTSPCEMTPLVTSSVTHSSPQGTHLQSTRIFFVHRVMCDLQTLIERPLPVNHALRLLRVT
jgi:hypothetical protein